MVATGHVGPADAYLLVRQVWIQGTSVMENVAAPYHLRPLGGPPSRVGAGAQRLAERATHVEAGQAMRGYLGTAEDTDWFVFTPARGGPVDGAGDGAGGGGDRGHRRRFAGAVKGGGARGGRGPWNGRLT